MNHYEQRQEARRQRLLRIAERFQSEGNARYQRARQMADAIPFGQPILVGHHSEKRDRNYRARIHSNFGKAFELNDKAKDYAARAAAVGTGGVSSDDPEAVAKLRAQLKRLEQLQDFMTKANKVVRVFWTAGVRDAEAGELWTRYCAKLRELRPALTDSQCAAMLKPDFAGRIGFASYQLANNGANVRRIKARLAALEQRAQVVAAAVESGEASRVHECAGYQVIENLEANRLQVKFPGKPSYEVRKLLKSHGFRWAPSAGVWQRMLGGFWIGFLTQPDQYLRKQLEAAAGGAA